MLVQIFSATTGWMFMKQKLQCSAVSNQCVADCHVAIIRFQLTSICCRWHLLLISLTLSSQSSFTAILLGLRSCKNKQYSNNVAWWWWWFCMKHFMSKLMCILSLICSQILLSSLFYWFKTNKNIQLTFHSLSLLLPAYLVFRWNFYTMHHTRIPYCKLNGQFVQFQISYINLC